MLYEALKTKGRKGGERKDILLVVFVVFKEL